MEDYRFTQKKEDDEDDELGLLARITREREAAKEKKKKERAEKDREQRESQADASESQSSWHNAESEKKAQIKQAKKAFFLDSLIEKKNPKEQDQAESSAPEQQDASAEVAPLEKLSVRERYQALQEYVRRRQEQLAQPDQYDNAEPEGHTQRVQRQAQRTFLQRVSEMVGRKQSEGVVRTEDDMLNMASEETIAFMHRHAAESEEDAPSLESEDSEPGFVGTNEQDQSQVSGKLEQGTATASYEQDDAWNEAVDEADDTTLSNASSSASMGQSSYALSASPYISAGSPSGPGVASSREEHGYSPTSPAVSEKTHSSSGGSEFLLGAFVGYLFGKRRGRIKAESEQHKVQKKLEDEVHSLESKIYTYEEKVRYEAERITENLVPPKTERSPSVTAVATKHEEEKKKAEPEDISPQFKEVNGLHSSDFAREAAAEIGLPSPRQQTSTQESSSRTQQGSLERSAPIYEGEQSFRSKQPEGQSLVNEDINTMTLSAVLALAERVSFNNTSVRRLFEQGDIDERALREALILRHRFGGDRYKERLRHHIESTKRHVNSPEMRDNNESPAASPATKSDNTAHEDLNSHKESAKVADVSNTARRSIAPSFMTAHDHDSVGSNPTKKSSAWSPQTQFLLGITLGLIAVAVLVAMML